jgi:ABC-type polysaccharide/polyol phosphate transport system ATPase subunit
MKDKYAIKVHDVKKKFRVDYDKGRTLKERILFLNRNKYEERWVLKGISFSVKSGKALGMIGENGCGKSTTLKLLTRIMYPDNGSIEINGRVSSLIELGAGFHPDMSGRENIYTNASIFGLNKREIDARLEKIIEFSELEEFIDNPVRTYSSGMYMRLAFSVAINVDADILLIDEILAVGDSNFQSKCFNKLRELKASGMTIVLVTHDSNVIENFCDEAIWLSEGNIISQGASAKVVDDYHRYMNDKRVQSLISQEKKQHKTDSEDEAAVEQVVRNKSNKTEEVKSYIETSEVNENKIDYNSNHFGLGYVEIQEAFFLNKDGLNTKVLRAGEEIELVIKYLVHKEQEEYIFGMGFYDLDGKCIMGSNTQLDRINVPHTKMEGIVRFKINQCTLLTGKYVLYIAVVDHNGVPLDFYRDYLHFDVISSDRSIGYVSMPHQWMIE